MSANLTIWPCFYARNVLLDAWIVLKSLQIVLIAKVRLLDPLVQILVTVLVDTMSIILKEFAKNVAINVLSALLFRQTALFVPLKILDQQYHFANAL